MAFTVLAWWSARPGQGEKLSPLLGLMRDHARDEVGCQAYEVHRSQDDADSFMLYEVYDDEVAYETHLNSEAFAAIGKAQAMPLLADRRREFHTRLQSFDREA